MYIFSISNLKIHVNQQFDAEKPNQIWVSDAAYFKYKDSSYYDNSMIETFFSSLKREELYWTKYRFEYDFKSAVDKYIVFYNTKRPHKKLQYKTPEHKEHEYSLKNAVK